MRLVCDNVFDVLGAMHNITLGAIGPDVKEQVRMLVESEDIVSEGLVRYNVAGLVAGWLVALNMALQEPPELS